MRTEPSTERWGYSVDMMNEESFASIGLVDSDVFHDFPAFKVVTPHGGGAIPYQLGRFDAGALHDGRTRFRDRMRHLHCDTALYSIDALELLVKTVGSDRCLFGAGCRGDAAVVDPDTGDRMDDLKPYILGFDWLAGVEQVTIPNRLLKGVDESLSPASFRVKRGTCCLQSIDFVQKQVSRFARNEAAVS